MLKWVSEFFDTDPENKVTDAIISAIIKHMQNYEGQLNKRYSIKDEKLGEVSFTVSYSRYSYETYLYAICINGTSIYLKEKNSQRILDTLGSIRDRNYDRETKDYEAKRKATLSKIASALN